VVAAGFYAVGKYGTSTDAVSHPEMPLAAPAE
jgi:AGZA family xanthine/uracil permease-like MFS transporter